MHPDRSCVLSTFDASLIALTSACAVASLLFKTVLCALDIILPSLTATKRGISKLKLEISSFSLFYVKI